MLSIIVAAVIFIAAATEILIVPATLADVRVSVFSAVWISALAAAAVLFIFIRRKALAKELKKSAAGLKEFVIKKRFGGVYGILAAVLILAQLFGSICLTHYDDDDSAYVTMVGSNIATDHFMRTIGQTGEEVPLARMAEYVTSGWYNFLSVICRIFGIHPLVLVRTILPPLMILLAYGVCILLSRQVFKNDEKRYLFLVFLSIINILNNVSTHTSSSILLMRMHQGKAIFANIIVPVMFCIFFRLWDEWEDWRPYVYLGAANTAACFFTTSGLAYGALLTVVFGLVLCFRAKRPAALLRVAAAVLPNAILGGVYVIERATGLWK